MKRQSGRFNYLGSIRSWLGAITLLACVGCAKAAPEPEIGDAAKAQLVSWLAHRGVDAGGAAYGVSEASCVDLGFTGDRYVTRPSEDIIGDETEVGCGSFVRIDGGFVLREHGKQVEGVWAYLEGEDPVGPATRELLDVCVDGTDDVADLAPYCPEDPECVKVGNQFRCCQDLESNTVECVHEWFWEDGWASEGCGYGLGERFCFELNSTDR